MLNHPVDRCPGAAGSSRFSQADSPLTAHEIATAVGGSSSIPQSQRPSEATITTWLYAITGSHDHPGVHRLDRRAGGGSICWCGDAEPVRGADVH